MCRWSAVAFVVLGGVDTAVGVLSAAPDRRLGTALLLLGNLMLNALILYGAWYRARWALWAGGVYVTLALLTVAVGLAGGVHVEEEAAQILTALQVLAYAGFLVGIALNRAGK